MIYYHVIIESDTGKILMLLNNDNYEIVVLGGLEVRLPTSSLTRYFPVEKITHWTDLTTKHTNIRVFDLSKKDMILSQRPKPKVSMETYIINANEMLYYGNYMLFKDVYAKEAIMKVAESMIGEKGCTLYNKEFEDYIKHRDQESLFGDKFIDLIAMNKIPVTSK